MKTKKLLTLLGVGAIALSMMPQAVKAEVVGSGETTATVTFEANTGVPSLINPDKPEEPTSVEDEQKTNLNGPLSLDYVPSISFGKNVIDAKQKMYSAEIGEFSPFVQVTDNRGTGAGWQLSASFSGFNSVEQEGKEVKTLPGTEIIFSNGEVVTNGSSIHEPTSGNDEEGKIKLTEEDAVVMDAGQDEGMGSWAMVWKPKDTGASVNENIQLKVPGGVALAEDYKATIIWELSTVPVPGETPTDTTETEVIE